VEFATPEELQAAVKKGLNGCVVAGRFLLATDSPKYTPGLAGSLRIDYNLPLPRCINVSENGSIRLKRGGHDLIIEAQLSRWAESISDVEWRLTQDSVSAATSHGGRVDHLLKLLAERQEGHVPAILRLAVTNWAGQPFSVEMETIVTLRCNNPMVFEALASSKRLKPFLRGTIFPDILVVDQGQLEALNAELAWANLTITPQLTITPLQRITKTWYR
jgi:hypothetical protein